MSFVEKETLDEIIKRIDENVLQVLDQAKKTNGRVNKLESWKSFVNGYASIAGLLLGTLCYFTFLHLIGK